MRLYGKRTLSYVANLQWANRSFTEDSQRMVVNLILNRWRFGLSHATYAYEDGVHDNYDNGGGRKTSLKNPFAFFEAVYRVDFSSLISSLELNIMPTSKL